jgi:hypothetical protein
MRLHFTPLAGTVRAVASALVCAVVFPALAVAQNPPLAEVARKEAERRKGVTQTTKVITTKDLPESARKPAAGTPSPAAVAETPPQTGDQKTAPPAAAAPADAGQRDEKYWRGRLTQAQEALRRNEVFAEALQTRINALTTDFTNHNDPYQRAKVGEDRVKALAELERVKNDVEQGKKQIADIEEEARKAGVPPGWLR